MLPRLLLRTPRSRAAMSTSQNPSPPADAPKPPLALPSASDTTTTTLDVSGEGSSVRLDHLGPLVVNTDGTMSRIGNWAHMADVEKETALRILARRNKERLEALRKKEEGC
ncbi:hypothetical protein E4U42_001600 [Claviceps africana]|uniref:Fungal specific transcription factor n=1 Tax=Claviceps africana TaxID=83212 RepID=A0A8K0NMS1_9HYPO|nr:hypothetical protein E4U42_001600 [Claviceps africana]